MRIMPPRHFKSNFHEGAYRPYNKVMNEALPDGCFSHQMLHKTHLQPGMGPSMMIGATSPLAPSRYLKNKSTKAWVSFLSESGAGQERRQMPGRADTTNAQHRAYTPSTLSRCRNEPVFSNKGKQRSASTIPLGREALLRNNVRQNRLVGEQLDPALLRMLLRQPEGEMRQKGGDEQYPPGPVRRLAMNGNPADQLPQENKPPHTFGVAYHGE